MQSWSLYQGLCCYEVSESKYGGDGNMLKVLSRHFLHLLWGPAWGQEQICLKTLVSFTGSIWYLWGFLSGTGSLKWFTNQKQQHASDTSEAHFFSSK